MKTQLDLQGAKANRSGKWLENQIEEALNTCGIRSLFFREVNTAFGETIMNDTSSRGFLLKNVPYINMFGGNSRGEFVLKLNNKAPIRIEARMQTVTGSVDEKIPYLIGNCYSFEEKHVILVLEGDGMREQARKFAKHAAGAIAHKDVRVYNLKQFLGWVNNTVRDQ